MNRMEDNNSFAFVQNCLDVKCELPFEVIPGYFFQKATEEQVNRIKKHLTCLYGERRLPYENKIVPKSSTSNTAVTCAPLKPDDWKYYIVRFEGYGDGVHDLQLASCLARIELVCGITFHITKNGGATQYSPFAFIFSQFDDRIMMRSADEVLTEQDLKEIGVINAKIKKIETEYPAIKRAIEMFLSLRNLLPSSDFHVLGLFAVIELLITHKPKNTERGDSLGHQIRTKIPLLAQRFVKPLDCSSFKETDQVITNEKIWNLLYDYRSNLAHGETPDFSSKLKVLKDSVNSKAFLKIVAKTMLRHALDEPQLYMDLRKC